jgi:hypothetical protein
VFSICVVFIGIKVINCSGLKKNVNLFFLVSEYYLLTIRRKTEVRSPDEALAKRNLPTSLNGADLFRDREIKWREKFPSSGGV